VNVFESLGQILVSFKLVCFSKQVIAVTINLVAEDEVLRIKISKLKSMTSTLVQYVTSFDIIIQIAFLLNYYLARKIRSQAYCHNGECNTICSTGCHMLEGYYLLCMIMVVLSISKSRKNMIWEQWILGWRQLMNQNTFVKYSKIFWQCRRILRYAPA
jgi:hypothetical protein